MKLAKKNGRAVLSIEIAGTGSGGGVLGRGGHVLVAHDVLIDVLRPNDLDKLKEPMCPPADVSAILFYVLFFESIPLRTIFGNMFSAFRLYLLFIVQSKAQYPLLPPKTFTTTSHQSQPFSITAHRLCQLKSQLAITQQRTSTKLKLKLKAHHSHHAQSHTHAHDPILQSHHTCPVHPSPKEISPNP